MLLAQVSDLLRSALAAGDAPSFRKPRIRYAMPLGITQQRCGDGTRSDVFSISVIMSVSSFN